MASDLISRKALLDLYDGLEGKGLRIPIDVLILNIEDQPTVDSVEVVHGEWINHFDDLFPAESYQECSVCHHETMGYLLEDNYCPNCGADMRGEKNASD